MPLANLSSRQVAYAACTDLYAQGIIGRERSLCSECGKSKTVNWSMDAQVLPAAPSQPAASERPWYWEGHVQAALVSWLVSQGYSIRSAADTLARTPGKDIIAVDAEGRELWVSVKGYPDASPNTQAHHRFAGAIFDLLLYRNESADTRLAVAFPDDFATYRNLAARITWLSTVMPFTIYWVAASGAVRVEG